MHTLVVNSTFCHWLLVVLPWSLYVIKAKHEVNLISIFNITRLNNRYILQGLSSLSFWPRTPQSDQTAVLCLSWKIFYQQHLIKVVWYCLYVGIHWELATKKPLCVCVCLSPLSVCLSCLTHREAWTHSCLCLCAHTAVDLAYGFNRGKDMVYYAMAYRFFHHWRAARALRETE